MSIKVKDLISAIEGKYPPDIQEDWDNSGWQVDLLRRNDEIDKVLVALEITNDVISEAKDSGTSLIIEHHPLFFTAAKKIRLYSLLPDSGGSYAVELIRSGISVYAAHTNFDTAAGGMNDALSGALGLTEVIGFPVPQKDASGKWGNPIGRMGKISSDDHSNNDTGTTFGDLIKKCEELFDMKGKLKTIGDPSSLVRTVALCGGAGGDFIPQAIREKADAYITSDVKHHEAQWAHEKGLLLIDGGHWGTEKIFVQVMADFLRDKFGERVVVTESQSNQDPWR